MSQGQYDIRNGRIFFDGCDTVELAERYGTPTYLLSETVIREKCAEIRRDFLERYPDTRAVYAAKAFLTVGMCRLIEREGLGLDVVSGGELYTAMKAAFPPERIEFNGNNKSTEELEMAVGYGVGRLIIDHPDELGAIAKICRRQGKRAAVLLRMNPEIEAHTHSYMTTGHRASKFGLPLGEEIFWPAVRAAASTAELDFLGYHFHIGSQLFEPEAYLAALEVALRLVEETKLRVGVAVRELNVGGGFGARYVESDRPRPYREFLDPLMQRLERFSEEAAIPRPALVVEPGRSIVAEAGMSLYRIGTIKRIPQGPTYAAVDGGMTDNIRPALYQAEYEAVLANKAGEPRTEIVTICGKCCESGDILIHDLPVALPERGDLLAMFSTGAYGYAMASNYNMLPLPPVILLNQGESREMVRRQTYEDILAREKI